MPVTTHQISLHGLAGAVFWCIICALVFYVLGFATVGWETRTGLWVGLWQVCKSHEYSYYTNSDWFKAVQAMSTIGLILLLACCIAIILYMFLHSASISKTTLLKAITGLAFAAVVFMVIGFIVFGAKHQLDINWSFCFSVIGSIFCLVAGILAVVQMKQSNVI